jgi:hypothetical protein
MRLFRTNHQDYGREKQRGSQASDRLCLLGERAECSPRAAVALTALSAVAWLREKAGWLVGRITGNWNTTVRQKVAAQTHVTSPSTLMELNDRQARTSPR